jgi:hypothetical protein
VGIIKDAKANVVRNEAERAIKEGRNVFATRLEAGWASSGVSGSISGMAEMIEAIEGIGWRMEHFSAVGDGSKALAIFRRK